MDAKGEDEEDEWIVFGCLGRGPPCDDGLKEGRKEGRRGRDWYFWRWCQPRRKEEGG